MIRQPVHSSNLKSIGYDEQQKILEIEFLNSGIYQYTNVSKNMFVDLMTASSKGKFFAKFIKDRFPTRKMN